MEYNITITDTAKKQLLSVATKNDVPYVRYQLDGGGCSGLIGKWGNSAELEEGDITFELGESKQFLIDKYTIEYMDGAIIDYTGDFMPAFKVTIPDTSSCGCGESFQMK
jgi:iron-sulfur cluster assembly accessory protein|tara:strand:- start:229 stop:555 length:327 start_codon:yes stop_codon:yes gene_type:complete